MSGEMLFMYFKLKAKIYHTSFVGQEILRKYASNNEMTVLKVFSESYTAKKPGRPVFNEMLDFARRNKNIKNILFTKADRATRNEVDTGTLVFLAQTSDINLYFTQENMTLNKNSKPMEFFMFSMNCSVSSMYPRNLSIEVSTKMEEKAKQGFYPSHAPVGYVNKRIKKRSYIFIDEQKAPFIRKIFELYATRQYSYRSLAEVMRKEGFTVSNTVKCGKTNIENILKNPVYMGDFIWNGKRYYNAKHDKIVSPELYGLCQQIIREKTTTKRNTSKNFLFSNIIKCSRCGCALVGEIKKSTYVYYHCTGNRGGDCKSKYIKEEHAEELFIDILKSIKLSDEAIKITKNAIRNEVKERSDYNKEKVKSLEKKITTSKNRLDKIFLMYLDGNIDETIYNEKRKDFEIEIEELSMELSALNKTHAQILDHSVKILELAKNAHSYYLNGSLETKQELVKLICSNFLYDGEKLTITIKKAFQHIVEIACFKNGGPSWTRTRDLTLIRRAL